MRVVRLAVLVAVALATRSTQGATASLSVDSAAIHAGMPFTLTLAVKGFEESPGPTAPELAIDGCTVTWLGTSPAVSTRITIVNGRTTEERDVTFELRWRVLAKAAGTYRIPALEVTQGALAARTPPATFEATTVPDTPDMIVRMRLPEDGAYVGETFDAAVEWLLARNGEDFELTVPLFNLPGAEVTAGPGTGRTVPFAAGAAEVDLAMVRDEEVVDGRPYARLRFPARVRLARAGSFDLDPVRVLAHLETGTTRDRLGFRRPQHRLYRAEGRPRSFVVRPLPVAGRPASFVNAIGGGFSLEVAASRTVVAVGDPIELTVRVRGDGPLAGLSLPPLLGPDGLPAAHFSIPDGGLTGRVDAPANAKVFTVTVRVTSAEAREIPPIAFSWFDPEAREYRTTRSRPIALAVEAAEVVGAGDVVAAPAPVAAGAGDAGPQGEESPGGGAPAGAMALIGADMSLSDPDRTLSRPWGAGDLRLVLAVFYGLPGLLLLGAWWSVRTRERRSHRRGIRTAVRDLERALAADVPAREAAPAIAGAMRRLADMTGAERADAGGLLERLETRAFDPAAAGGRVPDDLADGLRAVAEGWVSAARGPAAAGAGAALALAFAAALVASGDGSDARASEAPARAHAFAEARALYAEALAESDRTRRVRRFGDAEEAYRAVARSHPDAGRVQVDWGNAALGAQDAGRAVLAYRRALRAMPDDARARGNLAWVRGRMPAWLPRPPSGAGVLDSLLFWRGLLTTAQLHLIAGGAFALGLLAFAGGLLRGHRAVRIVAVSALAVWAVAFASAWASRPDAGAAVVIADGTTLRSADSAGAPPALPRPLPAGAEATIVETRGSWVRVRLADGTSGWLASGAVERVAPGSGQPESVMDP